MDLIEYPKEHRGRYDAYKKLRAEVVEKYKIPRSYQILTLSRHEYSQQEWEHVRAAKAQLQEAHTKSFLAHRTWRNTINGQAPQTTGLGALVAISRTRRNMAKWRRMAREAERTYFMAVELPYLRVKQSSAPAVQELVLPGLVNLGETTFKEPRNVSIYERFRRSLTT